MRYMNDIFIDGHVTNLMKLGKYYYFCIIQPISDISFICKTKLKYIKDVSTDLIVGIHGSIEENKDYKIINVDKIKLYGVEE